MLHIHKPMFILPDGTEKPYYKIKTKNKVVTIQDPFFSFDFERYDVCREEYTISLSDEQFIDKFMDSSERNSGLSEDQILWYSTGYWSIKHNKDVYLGLGRDAIKSALKKIRSGSVVFCLSNTDFCIFIKYKLRNRVIKETKVVIFASTIYRPWVEILSPFRKAIYEIGGDKYKKQTSTNTKIPSQTFQYYGQKGILVPYAISPTEEGFIGPTIIKNYFGPLGVDYLFAWGHHGWLKKDFFKPNMCFFFSGEVYLLDDVLIIRGHIVLPMMFESTSPLFLKEYSQNKALVDTFID
jgi:hypothetical protein